jgi:hypothetical protein
VRQLLQFKAVVTGGVERADYRAGAGADDDVGKDALAFQCLDDPDVSEAARRTPTQCQSQFDRLALLAFAMRITISSTSSRYWKSCC